MSELTPCNFCTLQGIKRREESLGNTVTVAAVEEGPMQGMIGVTISGPAYFGDDKPCVWFMALSEECCC